MDTEICETCGRELPESAFCEHNGGGQNLECFGYHWLPDPLCCRECCRVCNPPPPLTEEEKAEWADFLENLPF